MLRSLATRALTSTGVVARHAATAAPGSDDSFQGLVVGNVERGTRKASASLCRVKDIVGLERGGVHGNLSVAARLPAGECLSLIDICAARAATKHAFGRFTMGFEQKGKQQQQQDQSTSTTKQAGGVEPPAESKAVSVATISMDNILFVRPVMNGDVIDLRGTCVDVGSSSIAVNVEVRRVQFGSKERQTVANATVFMVAVNSSLQAAKVVPALELDDPRTVELHHNAKTARENVTRYKQLVKELSDPKVDVAALIQRVPTLCHKDKSKQYLVKIADTKHVAHRLFFPGHLNLNNTVFGGEILRWMEAHAVHCGRVFAKHRLIFTIGMHAIEFNQPVYKTDWMQLEAHVVYVKRTTMEVDVRVTSERNGEIITTNRATFVLMSLDEAGQPMTLPAGLDIAETDDSTWLRRHAIAAQRYAWLQDKRSAAKKL
jgi:acyl-CoA hydrolase